MTIEEATPKVAEAAAEVATSVPAAEPAAEDTSFEDTFGVGFGDDSGEDREAEISASEEVPAEEPQKEVKEAQGQEPAGAEPKQPKEEPKAETTKEAEAEPAGETPGQQEQFTTEQVQQLMQQRQVEMMQQLREHYKLSPEEAEELESNPAETLPKLAAVMHMEVLQSAIFNMSRMLPQLIKNISEAQTKAASGEQQFFQSWPQLADHRDTVMRYATMYRQMNPSASREQTIKDVGAMVAGALQVAAPPVATPSKPQERVVSAQPFASAAGGQRAAEPARINMFAQLDEELFGE